MPIYTLTVIMTDEGILSMNRTNDGFDAFQILGFLDFAREEVVEMIKGNNRPDVIKRQVVVDE